MDNKFQDYGIFSTDETPPPEACHRILVSTGIRKVYTKLPESPGSLREKWVEVPHEKGIPKKWGED